MPAHLSTTSTSIAASPAGDAGHFRPGRFLRRLLQSPRLEANRRVDRTVAGRAGPLLPAAGRNAARSRGRTAGGSEHRRQRRRIDNQTAVRFKNRSPRSSVNSLVFGAPTNRDEAGLRRLAAQLRAKKVVVKLFLRHPLHAKLYLLFRPDPINPTIGFLGSSNLTFAGLRKQGELNVDVLDHDACHKLANWFEDRWNDRWCLDISDELADIIDESWAREEPIPPYHIYLKMAYHLSQEARGGSGGVPHPTRLRRASCSISRSRR